MSQPITLAGTEVHIVHSDVMDFDFEISIHRPLVDPGTPLPVVYFSDASSKFQQNEYALDLLEGRPWGRLLVFDPVTGKTEVLLDGLYFANGVALSAKEDFVL